MQLKDYSMISGSLAATKFAGVTFYFYSVDIHCLSKHAKGITKLSKGPILLRKKLVAGIKRSIL